ncbi:hypothetical protein E4K65_35315 [Bradyrhizobium niftali]|uniref:Uncharacterized protein n=1 Tax=Bradyrhizobium niftali TaxID=2560055 RepID=A0A4Y9LEM2_9BRAD|nr:hypothetical protein E4K65_35315 [Bradyrhizobium niftali]
MKARLMAVPFCSCGSWMLRQPPSLRAKRSNPESFCGGSLDCFVARAPRNDGDGARSPREWFAQGP